MKLKLESTLIPGPLQLSRTSRWHGGRGMAMSTVVIPPRSLAPSPQRDAEGSLPGSLWLRGAWHERTSSTSNLIEARRRVTKFLPTARGDPSMTIRRRMGISKGLGWTESRGDWEISKVSHFNADLEVWGIR